MAPCKNDDFLSAREIISFLPQDLIQKTDCDFSDRIFIYDSLDSTNITAKEMALSDAAHGSIIIANYQTAGKGRFGRSFFSPPGHGLYMSFILDSDKLGFSTPTLVTAFAAVAVCDAIRSASGKLAQIKWVNDVFLDDRKICGILTEAVTCAGNSDVSRIVLGIGVNFSTPPSGFPDDLKNVAGSLFGTDTPPICRNYLAAEVIRHIVFSDNRFNEKDMLDKYKSKMFFLGETVVVTGGEEVFEATAVDIDDLGRLVVEKDNRELLSLSSGEVSIRK